MTAIKTILVADDDSFMRLSLKKVLEKAGYTVIEANDGKEAVDAFNKFHPDCVLLDGLMPNLDGFTACNQIRQSQQGKAVPVLIVSGLSKKEIKTDYPGTLATGYVSKPIDWLKILKKISRL